ncbi:uncharacterized protein B0H18DRAFT_1037543 [Fomitopsis serialis]|uniref:uncharacterized protein n=1 Tax=Fomitopsis serialis TaxID=139415 RepID=UPI002007F16D|nr:uncharacterized protein B0H18DRAFT_1037543 [Neoantrodia serialis]KAH9916710.1 hypothetical protein B0H18DRAFT_1037543 [Neoantrodia serialis]
MSSFWLAALSFAHLLALLLIFPGYRVSPLAHSRTRRPVLTEGTRIQRPRSRKSSSARLKGPICNTKVSHHQHDLPAAIYECAEAR